MLTNENYKQVLKDAGVALILITGGGCANCVSMYPIVKKLENTRDDIKVFYVEIDEANFEINNEYGVEVVPTILLTNKGELVAKIKGYQPEEVFEYYIDAKVAEINKD